MIRPFTAADLPAAMALQAVGYPPHVHDGEAAFASRALVAPSWCWAAETDGRLDGYLLSHPWASLAPPAPDVVLARATGPVWYVHDLSVAAHARGTGVGRALLAACRGSHPAIVRSELIAIDGAEPFWSRLGWRTVEPLPAALEAKIAGYGAASRYMVRDLT